MAVDHSTHWDHQIVIRHDPDAGGNRSILHINDVDRDFADNEIPNDSTVLSAQLDKENPNRFLLTWKEAPDGFGSLDEVDELDQDALGCESTTTEQIVDAGYSLPSLSYLDIASKLIELGNGRARYIRKSVDSYPTLIDEEEEPETGMEVLVARTIIDGTTVTSLAHGVARTVTTAKHLDCKRALKTVRTIHADILTTTFTEWHQLNYHFPSYLDPTTPFDVVNIGNNSVLIANKASDRSISVPCKFETTYHTSVQTPDEIFQFKPIDIDFRLPDQPIIYNDMITDAGTLSVQYGGTTVNFGIPASSPTATEYVALMASNPSTQKLIADECQRWKFNLYKRTKVYMPLPDIRGNLVGYLQ